MLLRASVFLIFVAATVGCVDSDSPINDPGGDGDGDTGDGDGDTGDGDGDTGDGDTGDGDTGDGDTGDGDTGDGDTGDGDTGDGDAGDGDTGDGDTGDGDGELIRTPGYELATLTEFESYPTSDEECEQFSGCDYVGYFSAFPDQKSEEWVEANNIAAVHSDDFDQYVWHTLHVKYNDLEIDVVVYDQCSDSDCDGCCTQNKDKSGFLIDLESYTSKRLGTDSDFVEWKCLDCD